MPKVTGLISGEGGTEYQNCDSGAHFLNCYTLGRRKDGRTN